MRLQKNSPSSPGAAPGITAEEAEDERLTTRRPRNLAKVAEKTEEPLDPRCVMTFHHTREMCSEV